MTQPAADASCPCGSSQLFARCCQPFLLGEQAAPSAEALMRSRYTAFSLGESAYLLETWHPSTRPAKLDLRDQESFVWLGLEILGTVEGQAGDRQGEVEFVARFSAAGVEHRLHERSAFRCEAGQWLYLDGRINPGHSTVQREKVGRNEPCPCGSGRKYKKCCLGGEG